MPGAEGDGVVDVCRFSVLSLILQLSVLDFSNFITDWENIMLRLKNDFIHSLGIMPLNFFFCLSYALFKGLLSSFPAVLAMQTLDFLSL